MKKGEFVEDITIIVRRTCKDGTLESQVLLTAERLDRALEPYIIYDAVRAQRKKVAAKHKEIFA